MAVKGYGATLKYQVGGSGSFIALGRVKSIKPAKITAKSIDTTVLDSADEFEEMIPGLASGGEIEVTLEYSASWTETLYGLFRSQTNYQVVYADETGWQYAGFLNEIGDDEVVNGEIVMTTVKIQVTGKPAQIEEEA